MISESRPPFPPFTHETAVQKVRLAEDAWNTCDPERVALGYTSDSYWRNRAEFPKGRSEIVAFLQRKWDKELDYRLIKELWAFTDNRIAVRFAYEWHDDSKNWFRTPRLSGRVVGSASVVVWPATSYNEPGRSRSPFRKGTGVASEPRHSP